MKTWSIIFFLLGAISINAQKKYQSVLTDIGNDQQISGAKIQAFPSNKFVFSNSEGEFKLFLTSEDQLVENTVYLLGNTLHWSLDNFEQIQIYDLKSALILQKNVYGAQSFTLPNLKQAYYIIRLIRNQSEENFMIYAAKNGFLMCEKDHISAFSLIPDTAIRIDKTDYFPLQISLTEFKIDDTTFILKKQYDSIPFFKRLISQEAFDMLSNTPSLSNYGDIKEIKVIHNLSTNQIYYINIKEHRSHYTFAKNYLGYELGSYDFLYQQFSNNPSRYLNNVTILHHENIDKYVLEFSAVDQTDCEGILRTYQRILETSYLKDRLFFYSNNLNWENCEDIPLITSEELYFGQQYQALNIEENYGYLIKAEVEQLQSAFLGRHHIVVLDGIPNDLPVVAGIITDEFQTPLSHINILSHNRNTPNMALKDAWSNAAINALEGQLVHLKVESDTFFLYQASLEDAEAFWAAHEPHDTIRLEIDTTSSGLIELENEDINSVRKIGGKAANFAELVSLDSIPLPEDYFAIPFYYYWQHIKANGLDQFIEEMLTESKFYSDFEYRKMRLYQLQNLIRNSTIDENLLALVEDRLDYFSRFGAYRFRSSTNAEDLENFSGAGLYTSTSAKINDADKTIARAIKKVWASLWDVRAFEERDYYKIDHKTVAMGILVHRSFPEEDANGVVITRNLYSTNHAYTINCQYKDYSIVYPQPGILYDQILLNTISLDENPFAIEYLTRSNIPELNGQTVLSDEELYELGNYCTVIKDYYYNHIAQDISCGYVSFSVDIEFKVDSSVSPRKLYIKQARIYKSD